MTNLDIAHAFVTAMFVQQEKEQHISDAFRSLCSESMIFGLATPIQDSYTKLVENILGKDTFEWVEWWMWETDFGQEPREFWTDKETKYDVSGLTFPEFFTIISK